jgi:RimJ/RimL family protein N-acetyltransferase
MARTTEARLRMHLQIWLGRWPSQNWVEVVGSPRRNEPGWDGRIFPLIGVATKDSAVISVPPGRAAAVEEHLTRLAAGRPDAVLATLMSALPALLDRPDRHVYQGVFRWCERPADLPDAGVWVDADERVPQWLRPFGHQVLIAWDPDTGEYLAGVGLKHHDRYGRELAVGTEPAGRGRGLARRLVAQAARRILDEGAIPTYQHDPANLASARVAEAAGFADRGWRSLGL